MLRIPLIHLETSDYLKNNAFFQLWIVGIMEEFSEEYLTFLVKFP